jgi:putative SOS response-associated peptidase YedK
MCGRYGLFVPADEIAGLFGIEGILEFPPRFNIAPSQPAPVVVGSSSGTRVGVLRWGLYVGSLNRGRRQINARSETVHTRPALRTAIAQRRCLVLASGFYEWRMEEEGKVPYWIHSPAHPLLAMAGIWGRDPILTEDQERQTGEPGYAIVTRAATAGIQHIHARMPALLSREDWGAWLDSKTPVESLRAALSRPIAGLSAHPVSSDVNRPDCDRPDCVEPVGVALF